MAKGCPGSPRQPHAQRMALLRAPCRCAGTRLPSMSSTPQGRITVNSQSHLVRRLGAIADESIRTLRTALRLAILAPMAVASAQAANELSAAPGAARSPPPAIAGAALGWYPCLVTAQCNDKEVGSGALATNAPLAARVRITNWQYEAGAVEFKGSRLATHLDSNELGYVMPRHAGGSTTADAIVGMRVGGRRVVAVARQQFVFEVELLELAEVRDGPRGAVLPKFRVLWPAGNYSDEELRDEFRRTSRGDRFVGDIRHARVIENAVRSNRLCSAGSIREPSKVRTAIFGLVVGAPLPCVNACDDERRGEPRTFVCLKEFRATAWGTQVAEFSVADGYFDSASIGWFGRTSLEVSQGNLVGIQIKGISRNNAQAAVVDLLSSKFGSASVKGSTYQWSAPSASVRYVTDDDSRSPIHAQGQVDTDHPFGEGLVVGDSIVQGTITVYSPELRARIEEFEQRKAEQARRDRKPAF
jgi:hypothetical protein